MDMSEYLSAFLDESSDQLEQLNDLILLLEKDPQSRDTVNEIFRIAHTLKGMAAAMGYEGIANLTHALEDMLDMVRNGEYQLRVEDIDLIFKCLDLLSAAVGEIREKGNEGEMGRQLSEMAKRIKSKLAHGSAIQKKEESAEIDAWDALEHGWFDKAREQGLDVYKITIKIASDCALKSARAFLVLTRLEEAGEVIKTQPSVEDLERENFGDGFVLYFITKEPKEEIEKILSSISDISLFCVELIDADEDSSKSKPNEQNQEEFEVKPQIKDNVKMNRINESLNSIKQQQTTTVRVDIGRLDKLMNLVGELVIGRARIERLAAEAGLSEFEEPLLQLGRISTEIQEIVTKLRMVPVAYVFDRFPRMVRDLCRNLGKEAELFIEGSETELDRTVIDEIGDPMIHLLRNALDHGIETPQERISKGKPRKGSITIAAFQEGNSVLIEVMDDGRGIDPGEIKKKAVEKGVITKEEAEFMPEDEALALVCLPGFSTSEKVTDLSGRGVGMDVVKNKVESLGGQFHITSKVDEGTKVTIKLPLTLAIVLALLIRIGDETYAISLENVEETLLVDKSDTKYVHGSLVTTVRGEILSLHNLKTLLNYPGELDDKEEFPVVVVRVGASGKRRGLIVDELIGQQDIVIKPLGKLLSKVRGMAGATILGDGKVALILDVAGVGNW
ncbi:chemotaxis protein CheA [Acetomicrobium hydrogeniformans]|uniref:Chemotaxis protein CheA n=1 Tax=Acetomicrobium hydrogeniformans ATCC BAA-1850 TaxID=592015 RepID=A0A0T5XB82_9BACT|nr:chemotaxis protein CheA [Acetomicrobium hydrogeniformans]KRT35631.1 putative chemotaxis protein CheA [Acetomicrobium hydrogeniformans ATCC BAA-1850]